MLVIEKYCKSNKSHEVNIRQVFELSHPCGLKCSAEILFSIKIHLMMLTHKLI